MAKSNGIEEGANGMLGDPKFTCGELVRFAWKEETLLGEIRIADAYGICGVHDQPYYDVVVWERNCLYKHIPEEDIESLNIPNP